MKPPEICHAAHPCDPLQQLAWEGAAFDNELAERGLACRVAVPYDLDRLLDFLARIYADDRDYEPKHVIARVLHYGCALVIEEKTSGLIVAAQLAELYADPERTVQALRYAVDPQYRGWGLGAKVVRRHAHLCALRGGRIRRGVVDPLNLASVTGLLNEVGCVADGYDTELYAPEKLLTLVLPLTAPGLVENRIDVEAMKAWVLAASPRTYSLIDYRDADGIAELYRRTGRHIVGVLPGGKLLAVPNRIMF